MLVSAGDQLVDRYRVTQLLGRGGMGEVWAANDLAAGRRVAVKVLLERAERRRDIKRRFEREAEAASRIHSRHVCALLDRGWTRDGSMFLVFELLEGESLADRLRREEFLPLDHGLTLTLDVLQGIADAHAAQVLHRDLKPGNIFITPGPDNAETGVVLDFGVSKLVQEVRLTDEPSLTAYDGTVGSFAYMAPEQVRGAARVDERADVYGAASVAFRALAGRLPFEGLSAKMVASLKLERMPPSLEEATGFAWPRALEAFFAGCLARDPNARTATAIEARDALREVLEATRRARGRARN